MSSGIKTYDDLVNERDRMKTHLSFQRQKISDDWDALKLEFEPVSRALGTVGKFTRGDRSNPIVNMGLQLVGDMFIKNFVLAKAGWITKLTVPFVMKNYSSHVLADKGKNLLTKFTRLLNRKRRASDS